MLRNRNANKEAEEVIDSSSVAKEVTSISDTSTDSSSAEYTESGNIYSKLSQQFDLYLKNQDKEILFNIKQSLSVHISNNIPDIIKKLDASKTITTDIMPEVTEKRNKALKNINYLSNNNNIQDQIHALKILEDNQALFSNESYTINILEALSKLVSNIDKLSEENKLSYLTDKELNEYLQSEEGHKQFNNDLLTDYTAADTEHETSKKSMFSISMPSLTSMWSSVSSYFPSFPSFNIIPESQQNDYVSDTRPKDLSIVPVSKEIDQKIDLTESNDTVATDSWTSRFFSFASSIRNYSSNFFNNNKKSESESVRMISANLNQDVNHDDDNNNNNGLYSL